MSEVVLLLPILTPFNKLNILSEVVLLLSNTDRLQQVEDYVRGCSTSTKYWPPSTSWRLCQRLFYFYQLLTAFNKLKIMLEVVLFLPITDHLQQVEDYVRGWTTSTKYWPHSTIKLKIMSDVVLLLPITDRIQLVKIMSEVELLLLNTDHLQLVKIMSEVVLFLPNTDSLQQVEDYVRCCSTSTNYWPPSTSWRLC